MNSVYEEILAPVRLPEMYKVSQKFDPACISDIPGQIVKTVSSLLEPDALSGRTVALGVGSRGISHIALIARSLVEVLKGYGADVFIVPSMGSHGGAIAENQRSILEHLGVTEEYTGAPIRASMDTVVIGETEDGVPVHMDRNAASADYTVTIARIKPHSSFRGRYESGMTKMCVIGLGKQHGADYCHFQGMANMGKNLEKIGRVFVSSSNLLFSLGIIENAYDEPCFMEAIPRERMMEEEPALLERARSLLPSIPFRNIDLLVVDEIGKNITGTGMDCNIIQRFTSEHMVGHPFIKRIVFLDLTDESDGNGCGFGLADVTTMRAYRKLDMDKTYPNLLTSRTINGGKIPMVMANDYDAIRAGIKTAPDLDYSALRIVRIRNTLSLDSMEISSAMLPDAEADGRISIASGPFRWEFGEDGNMAKGEDNEE